MTFCGGKQFCCSLCCCFAAVLLHLARQAVLDDSGKKPAEGLGGENAFKDFDFSRAAMANYEANAI